MSPAPKIEEAEWIGVKRASRILHATPYAVLRSATAGTIRTRLEPPFRTVFNRSDVESLATSFQQS